MDFPNTLSHDECNRDLVLLEAMRGGYPSGRNGTPDERHDFFHDLIREICEKDLPLVSNVRNPITLRKVYRMIGAASGGVVSHTQIADVLEIGRTLVKRCIEALKALRLVDEIPVWPESTDYSRSVRNARTVITDSGWLCVLLSFCAVAISDVVTEHQPIVRRLIFAWTWAQLASLTDNHPDWRLWHFALRTSLSIDMLLEHRSSGDLIAFRVLAQESVSEEDFAPLKKFRALVSDRHSVQNVVLYCGQSVQRFDGVGAAVPVAFLWR